MQKIISRNFIIKMIGICFLTAVLLFTARIYPVFGKTAFYEGPPAKYTFFFIGDGMGMPQRTAAEMYMSSQKKSSNQGKGSKKNILLMNEFAAQGVTTTYAADRFITGSAAAGTALACGIKTNINYIGVNPNFQPVKTIAEMAKEKGMKVGIVSSVSIDHATPASFYAHQPTRKMYHEIGMELAESGFDYFGGGGFKDPAGKKSRKPLGNVLLVAKKNGYKIVDNRRQFMALTKKSGKVIALNKNLPDGQALPYQMDNTSEDIALAEFTKKGIELLDNSKGFFMMVEGGKIDWACHANDAVASIKDTLAFDEAIRIAYDFYKKHPEETLIVVTGDHECGGLTLGFAGTAYASHFDILNRQKSSFQVFTDKVMAEYKKNHAGKAKFEDMIPLLNNYFGLETKGDEQWSLKDYELAEIRKAFIQSMAGVKINKGTADYLLYGGYDPFTVKITHILNRKAGLAWTTYSHTGVPVLTSAVGVGAKTFNGYYDNTDVAKKLMAVMGVLDEMRLAVK